MDSPDLNGLFVHFDQKISNICAKLALLNVYIDNNQNECTNLNSSLGNIQYMLHEINKLLIDAEKNFEIQTKRCEQLWNLMDQHVEYIENNLPVIPAQPETKTQPIERHLTYTNINVKNLKNKKKIEKNSNTDSLPTKVNPKEETMFPMMEFITEQEYDSIPKYMLSRLSLKVLNDSVEAFNFTINAKYTFMKKFDVQSTKEAEYKRYKTYKAQENGDTKGLYFVTINDIKELSSMKNDSTLRKVLICLRHCKRVKEIRGNPQKLIRYVLI